jgi:sugar phosphate isomerase/epimerase
VLLENVWEADPEMFRGLLDKVASPRLKFCFDIGHANVYSKVSFEQWISTLCADITYMHLSDNDGAVDQHLEVGKGKIHWRQFTDTLDRYGLSPEVVLEEGSLDKTKASLAFMKENAIYPF